MTEVEAVLPAGSRLRYRLERNASRGAQIGCAVFVALLLGTLAFFLLRSASRRPGEEGIWLFYAVGGGFGLVALLAAYGAIQQTLALRTPELLLEIDSAEIHPGESIVLFLQQTGDGSYESIRANLVGEERKRRVKSWDYRHLGTFNMFDSGPFDLDGTKPFETTFAFDVPPDLEPSADEVSRKVVWNFEVWGKIRGRADYQHVFPIEVVVPDEG